MLTWIYGIVIGIAVVLLTIDAIKEMRALKSPGDTKRTDQPKPDPLD